MALSARLQLRQAQSLVITPQLMQAIRLLQMSGVELERFVAAEIEANPLLGDGGETYYEADGEPEGDGAGSDGGWGEGAGDGAPELTDDIPEEPLADHSFSRSVPHAAASDRSDVGIDLNLPASESLPELLERQIDSAFAAAPPDRMIALTLLAGLDEAGYLAFPFESVAARLGVPAGEVERVLHRCQELAPTGLFARSLAECLALQLEERNRLDPAMQALLANLPLLAAGNRASLCALCGVDGDDLNNMITELRALDPKPGLAFGGEPIQALIPDAYVRAAPGGGWTVELNEESLPRLIVDRAYSARLGAGACRDQDRKFLSECLQKASWLEKSLDQRARTVLSVATEIVRRQEGFFADGVAALKPLNLRMVADTLGVHESTVSRAAANKTMSTPRGVFEFRFFFTGAIPATAGGDPHSAAAVKHRISKMVSAESSDSVLSDDAIVALLSREGVEIARRTVAKYREAMGVGSSVERRREKRLRAAG